MNNKDVYIKRLSAFATLRSLYNEKKTKYSVVAEFIFYILKTEHIVYPFKANEIGKKLTAYFDFHLPIGVIEGTLCRMPHISICQNEEDINITEYTAKINDIPDVDFTGAKSGLLQLEEEFNQFCVNNGYSLTPINFTEDLCVFLLDDSAIEDVKTKEVLSLFMIYAEDKEDLSKTLNSIKEGSVLFSGLNYDVECNNKKKLSMTLFLDTEIVFNLAGYNGDVYKILADDLFNQVSYYRRKGHDIKTRIFQEIENEINRFFYKAERIVSGIDYETTYKIAMRNIVSGCKDRSDVQIKKAKLFQDLKTRYGIITDSSMGISNTREKNIYDSSEVEMSPELESELYLGRIKGLRGEKKYEAVLDSDCIFITETNVIIEDSKKSSINDLTCDYAIRMGNLTNMLWYHQNQGFGGAFPVNVNVAIQAKTILSKLINTNVSSLYTQAKENKNGFSDEEINMFISSLHEIKDLPEELDCSTSVSALSQSTRPLKSYFEDLQKEKNQNEILKQQIENEKKNLKSLSLLNESLIKENDSLKKLEVQSHSVQPDDETIKKNKMYRLIIGILLALLIYYMDKQYGFFAKLLPKAIEYFSTNSFFLRAIRALGSIIISVLGNVVYNQLSKVIRKRGARKHKCRLH